MLQIATVYVMTERVFTNKDRTFTRTQGCWNCRHRGSATVFWSERRVVDLKHALAIAHESPQGEQDQRVTNIKQMVNRVDHLVAKGQLGVCSNPGGPIDAKGKHIEADLFQHSFLCSKWDAAQGASLAREGAKADDLPEELVDKVDGDGSISMAALRNQLSILGRKTVS